MRRGLVVIVVCMAACDGSADDAPATTSAPTSTTASTAAATAAVSALPPAPRPRAAPSPKPEPKAKLWFGAPDPGGRLERTRRFAYERRPGGRIAELGVPHRWLSLELGNGMSENFTAGIMTLSRDKKATVLVIDHGHTHESLVEYGAGGWFGQAGGGTVKTWGPVEEVDVDGRPGAFTLRRGKGRLRGRPADVLMLRRAFPSLIDGPSTLILVGAIAKDADPALRKEYHHCLATFRDLAPP